MNSSETININQISYDKSSKLLTINVFDFTFVGNYKKSVRISELLDDLYTSLGKTELQRENFCVLDANNLRISESSKIKNLKFFRTNLL